MSGSMIGSLRGGGNMSDGDKELIVGVCLDRPPLVVLVRGPPASYHPKESSPERSKFQLTSTVPPAFESDPYLDALVASSWTMSANVCVAFVLRMSRGPLMWMRGANALSSLLRTLPG